MELIKPELLAKYTSKEVSFLFVDVRITLYTFIAFFLHISTYTFYLFLSSVAIGWILAILKIDVNDFFILIKENLLKLFKVNNIKKIRY